jgi:hypothetical protein
MLGMLVTALFALGCFLIVVSLPLQSAGSALRRIGTTLIVIPLAGCLFFGALKEAIRQQGLHLDIGDGVSMILGLAVLSVIAYVILKVRRRASMPGQPKRMAMKRPYSHQRRGGDVISFIREQLDRDE